MNPTDSAAVSLKRSVECDLATLFAQHKPIMTNCHPHCFYAISPTRTMWRPEQLMNTS